MKNRDKDGGLKWIFKTYFKLFLKQSVVKMSELCSLHIFKVQTPQYGESYPQKGQVRFKARTAQVKKPSNREENRRKF